MPFGWKWLWIKLVRELGIWTVWFSTLNNGWTVHFERQTLLYRRILIWMWWFLLIWIMSMLSRERNQSSFSLCPCVYSFQHPSKRVTLRGLMKLCEAHEGVVWMATVEISFPFLCFSFSFLPFTFSTCFSRKT